MQTSIPSSLCLICSTIALVAWISATSRLPKQMLPREYVDARLNELATPVLQQLLASGGLNLLYCVSNGRGDVIEKRNKGPVWNKRAGEEQAKARNKLHASDLR